jgi:hypothetical protein
MQRLNPLEVEMGSSTFPFRKYLILTMYFRASIDKIPSNEKRLLGQSVGLIMNSQRQIAVMAPERMQSAFSVLIESAPNHCLLASSDNLDELQTILGEKKPDVILIYLVQENGSHGGKAAYGLIARIKTTWPDALCLAIVKYASQLDKAREFGADLALVDGVNAEKLLAAIGGKSN